MRYIKIEANENGSHDNQFSNTFPGEGWAIVPEEIVIPNTFPFVSMVVENGIVIEINEGEAPERQIEISSEELILLTLVDYEERLCMIELGVNV